MVALNRTEFLKDLEAAVDRAMEYKASLGSGFEVRLMISGLGVLGFRQYGLGDGEIILDKGFSDYYIYGFRTMFITEPVIPSLIPTFGGVIEPVVICRDGYGFPDVHMGTYVVFGDRFIQIVGVDHDGLGNKSFRIKDVDVYFCDHLVMSSLRHKVGGADPLTVAMHNVQKRNAERDAWVTNPDTSAISDYLDSLKVT